MPELPEVEITRRGLYAALAGRRVDAVAVRTPALRYPIPSHLGRILGGSELRGIGRRGKYLLFDFGAGTLIVHLGMSGSLRLAAAGEPAGRHDHLDIGFGRTVLRLRDPRRFGAVLWEIGDGAAHPLIATLGMEPLSTEFTPDWLHAATRGRATAIKQFLMDSHQLVGIGNIYAAESLFGSRIDPRTAAGRLARVRCARLAFAIRETLEAALAAGGSTLRDFVHSDGSLGRFQEHAFVYGREGLPCRHCGARVRAERIGQRNTFYCPRCQR